MAECTIEQYYAGLSAHWGVSEDALAGYVADLRADDRFLSSINAAIRDVPEFGGKQFTDVAEMRVYRVMLYLAARALKPRTFIETGVHNGMGSAFILLGLEHNGAGRLVSFDLPPDEQRIIDQGTNVMPNAKPQGWIIPDWLRHRHDLRLGRAELLLPPFLDQLDEAIDVFLHDSDHCYSHMMVEMGLAWPKTSIGGWIMADNVEQNSSLFDFAKGVGSEAYVVSSFDGPDRTWQHGMFQKVPE